tara:strand:- start:303 stop:800 length:498 start_codon:yes stop_codon:yes gene_type:complete
MNREEVEEILEAQFKEFGLNPNNIFKNVSVEVTTKLRDHYETELINNAECITDLRLLECHFEFSIWIKNIIEVNADASITLKRTYDEDGMTFASNDYDVQLFYSLKDKKNEDKVLDLIVDFLDKTFFVYVCDLLFDNSKSFTKAYDIVLKTMRTNYKLWNNNIYE